MEFMLFEHSFGDAVYERRIEEGSYFVYIESGSGTLKFRDKVEKVYAGDFFVLFTDELHSYYPDDNDPWWLKWFGINGEALTGFLEQAGIKKEYPVIRQLSKTKAPITIENILYILIKNEMESRFDAFCEFFWLLSQIAKFLNSNSDNNSPFKKIEFSKRFIDMYFFQASNTDLLAKQVGYCRTYYIKLFKSIVGKTPMEYLVDVRLKKAVQLLLETNLKIQDVSYFIGFEDCFYFSKLFKKRYGISPSEYKKMSTQRER